MKTQVRRTSGLETQRGFDQQARGRRLLLCTYGFPPTMGPRGLRLLQLSRGLSERGWEIDVLTARQSPSHLLYDKTFVEDFVPPGVRVFRTYPGRSMSAYKGDCEGPLWERSLYPTSWSSGCPLPCCRETTFPRTAATPRRPVGRDNMTHYRISSQHLSSNFSKSELNTRVFDETAVGFGSAIDRGIQQGRYLRGELFVRAAIDHIEPRSFILDYGCGPGRISLMLARNGYRVFALDPSPAMIAVAKHQSLDALDIEFRVCTTCPRDLPAIPYEAIVCSSVIEYVPDPEQLLRWFSAALHPSGLLIVSFANSRSIWGGWCRLRHTSAFRSAQRHMWSWPQFRRLLKNGGFAPEARPVYFESPFDRIGHLRAFMDSPLGGTLGLVVARRCGAHSERCVKTAIGLHDSGAQFVLGEPVDAPSISINKAEGQSHCR